MSKLICYGGAGHTTGANFLLEFENPLGSGLQSIKTLIDCGMLQGAGDANTENAKKFEYDVASIDMLFVTHAHIDHVGLIPKLYKEGFRGAIYSTAETKSIAELLLMDAAKINAQEISPIYGFNDVSNCLALWQTLPYHTLRDFGGFSVELYDAGHVLGSSMIKFTSKNGNTILCTGDIGNSPSPILKDAEKVDGINFLLMESVYGDRNHESKEVRDEKFERVVRESIERGGTLLIPAFSL
ncbi:MAG: MBL fold metallo-hydrolase, partial [bacterium]|nr:MBL fold metallo-hydrolase [bacterium]